MYKLEFLLASGVALALLAAPLSATATDFSFKVEPGVSIPLTAPQSKVYGVGGGQSVKALFGLNKYIDVGPSGSFLFLPARTSGTESGVAWTLGAGGRFKRPHDETSHFGISPWLDVDALYVRTAGLSRPGFDVAVGASMPVGSETRTVWIGPFARFLDIGAHDHVGTDSRYAKILTVGVSLELGSGVGRPRDPEVIRDVTHNVVVCPDRDSDGMPDNLDHCPDIAGPADNWGCPAYKKLTVKRDKLELNEKLYFAWDQAVLQDVSFPVLDEVVQALKDNRSFKVQVEGHTSSEGGDEHNQPLSEKRAQAVLDYLVAHGISQDRLVSKGFASSVPIDTNTTSAGRENNRRVEFVVYFSLLNDGSK